MSDDTQKSWDVFVSALVAAAAPAMAEAVIAKVGDRLRAADNPLLTVQQSAKHVGLSPQTIRNLVRSGVLKRAKGLTDIRIRKSELDAYGK
jgi:excisionase family DNA binding protein